MNRMASLPQPSHRFHSPPLLEHKQRAAAIRRVRWSDALSRRTFAHTSGASSFTGRLMGGLDTGLRTGVGAAISGSCRISFNRP
jgi:hypothetical protein